MKDSFNYHLSVRRKVIERAFGILTKRWGIFSRPVCCKFNQWSLLATVCAKLHNICIDYNIPTIVNRYTQDWQENDSNVVYVNDIIHDLDNGPTIANGRTTGARRLEMSNRLHSMGVLRPMHASANSKA
jgi:hypothetical protein